ncbi:glycosyltransferase [Clostridium botulinum]|uniref:glycosyltransferase n=1 Tax=Clostridium botulinum TaxID=1491 RepID=UPI003DA21624
MNILHITTFLQGGAGRMIKDIALYQKYNGNNVYILTSKTGETGYCNYEEYINEFNKENISVFFSDSTFKRDIYLNLNVVKKLKNIIREKNIDIIHAHAAVPAMVSIIARSGLNGKYIPVIQTMHGWGTNKKLQHEKMDIIIMNSLDKIVTVSKSDEKLMISKGINSLKLTTIYNGVKEKNINSIEDDEIIKELKIKKQEGYNIIGCIGTVCKRKNQQLLINAIKCIKNKEKIFCAFIGEGDMLADLQLEIEHYKLESNVKFYGYKSSASKYLKCFDFFVLPSLSEGFSISILEALKEMVPVICSNIGTFTEIIEDNVTGFLFKNNNLESLKKTIVETINKKNNNTIQLVINSANQIYKSKFTFDIMMLKYNKIYNEE